MEQLKRALNDSPVARWTALILIALAEFASYYFYDVFTSVKSHLQVQLELTNAEYGAWYGVYSFTNAFLLMAFLGGIMLDRWGIRKTGTLFISFMLLGSIMTAYGSSSLFKPGAFAYGLFESVLPSYSAEFKMIMLGRLVFGLGCETLYVTINKTIAKWFKGKELALAFGITLAIARFGTAAALSFAPRLVEAPPMDPAAWIGVMFVVISFIAFMIFLIMDVKLDKSKADLSVEKEPPIHFKEIFKLFSNRSFIYITFLCILFYSAVFPFIGFTPDFLHHKFGFSEKLSGDLTSMIPYGTVLFTPLFGWVCDNRGKSASLMIWGSVILIIVFLTFSLTSIYPFIPLVLLGVAFSLVPAAMWPSVARIVPERLLGTAYGFMFTVQNYGMMLIPWLLGRIVDISNKNQAAGDPLDYTWGVMMLSLLGIMGVFFAILLKRDDKISGFGLELPNKSKH